MNVVILWGVIAILCAVLQSFGIWKYGLACGFMITTALLAIHYDFGNDYWSYYDWFEESLYTPLPNSIATFLEISRDPGWDLLNIVFGKIFGENGFFIMVAILSIIESVCYYTFIKKYVPTSWHWFAMTLYILNNHFFVLTFSMMRQALVMALLLICFIWIQEGKIILPVSLILFASTIHNSVLLCLPLVIIPYIPSKNQKTWAIILLVTWLLFLVASSILEPILTNFAGFTEAFARYVETYTDDSKMTFGLGYILRLLPFTYLLYGLFTNQFTKEDLPILLIWSLTIILTPFGMIIPLFNRFLFYFELASFAAFPKIINIAKTLPIRCILALSILLLIVLALYDSFYKSDSVYFDYYINFHTIFEVI
jgi:hypothetical protein